MPVDDSKTSQSIHLATTHWQRLQQAVCNRVDISAYEDALHTLCTRSHFVAEQLIRNPDWIPKLADIAATPDKPIDYQIEIEAQTRDVTSEDGLMDILRDSRNFYMVSIAWCDLLNLQSIERSLRQVSSLADALINGAYHSLYRLLQTRYGAPAGPEGDQPMYILGMGKLGGEELNFSSDIDLIFAYPAKGETQGARKPIENHQFFTKLAQKLINTLNKITHKGQVFRVDMRLRPFGESGPLVMHFAGLEDYYQEQGRQWERFAMVKARVINRDNSPYQAQLHAILQPFTYRKYLDFTTIDALRDMKQLIAKEIRRRNLSNNIKLGTGGIREVEFFAQSFQLIHAGRLPHLQHRSLLTTLNALADEALVEREDIQHLVQDYLFLRKIEHTLQQAEDKQTQTLPDRGWQRDALLAVMNMTDDAFCAALDAATSRIHGFFNELIGEAHDTHDDTDSLFSACKDVWHLTLERDEFIAVFNEHIGVEHSDALFKVVSEFKQKQRAYRLGQRGQDSLNKLLPEILYVLITQSSDNTDQVLTRVLNVIEAITGRTTYLDLLLENHDVLKQLVNLCERSEWIANEIRRFPILLDELLTPLYLQQQNTHIDESRLEYQQSLRETLLRVDADDVEALMDTWRQFKLCQQLRIAASDLSGSIPIACVSDKLTVLAEVTLEHVLNAAWQHVTQRYGRPEHLPDDETGFAVIGYGKLGGYELGYGSDLDLVFLHNAPNDAKTNGDKCIEAQQFYIKLAQRIMHLLSTKTLFGQLYEVDLRLRPSGNAGLLCCHINGFIHYQQHEAWTWEHQALVRARGILGDRTLLDTFEQSRRAILAQKRDLQTLKTDVVSMREKMRQHLLNQPLAKLDLKQCQGGITDVEFLTQFWVLGHASESAAICHYTDNLRLLDALEQHRVISNETASQLQSAYLQLRDQYHQLTLANHKFAQQSDDLTAITQRVTQIWNDVF